MLFHIKEEWLLRCLFDCLFEHNGLWMILLKMKHFSEESKTKIHILNDKY